MSKDPSASSLRGFTLALLALAGLGFAGVWLARVRPSQESASSEPIPPRPLPVEQAPSIASGAVPAPAPAEGQRGYVAVPAVVPPRSPREVASLKAEILDGSLSPDARVRALQQLRYKGEDWKSPEILSSMSALIRAEGNDGARRNICRLLRGVDHAELRQGFIHLAAADPNSEIRKEAARALREAGADPLVQQALRQALESERSPAVRQEIELTLFAGRK